jgi:hypothetical protein
VKKIIISIPVLQLSLTCFQFTYIPLIMSWTMIGIGFIAIIMGLTLIL